jgi:hypothetical protein
MKFFKMNHTRIENTLRNRYQESVMSKLSVKPAGPTFEISGVPNSLTLSRN